MSRVNPMTQSDKTSQLETGPLFKPDFRQTCSLHRSSELSCTFYPELFPPAILRNHLCVILRLCDLTQYSCYLVQQSKNSPTFIAKWALLYTLATWLMKMSENPEKIWLGAIHLLLANWLFLVWGLLHFTDFKIYFPAFNSSGCDVYCHSNNHQSQT